VIVAAVPVERSWRDSNGSQAKEIRRFRRRRGERLFDSGPGARKKRDKLMLSHLDVLTIRDDRPGIRNGDVAILHRTPAQDALRITFLARALWRNDRASGEGFSTGRPGLAMRVGGTPPPGRRL
jgi:hypothetical protein